MAKRKSTLKSKSTKRTALAVRSVKRPQALLTEIQELIRSAHDKLARSVNAGLTLLYWQIGRRIREDVLREKRAEYGKKIVSALGTKLSRSSAAGLPSEIFSEWCGLPRFFPTSRLCHR